MLYPMLDVGRSRERDYWNDVADNIIGSQYKHAFLANKSDKIYIDFLKKMHLENGKTQHTFFKKTKTIDELTLIPEGKTNVLHRFI